VAFLVVRDRSGLAQVVLRPDELPDGGLPPEESVVEVTGLVTPNAQASGGVEVTSPRIRLLSDPASTPPVELWRPTLAAGLPTLLDHAAVTWRHPRRRAAWEIAAASLRGFRRSLDDAGFTEIHTPKLVATATESGANVFPVDYFGQAAYLAQSPQLYKQQLVGVFERVYEVAPVFRAEPHDTVRHLAEYVSLDVELGFVEDHRDVLEVLRLTLTGMLDAVRAHAADAVDRLGLELPVVPAQIPVIHFADALRRAGARLDEPDLAPEDERALGEWAKEELGSDLLAVEGYPLRKRPFYTHPWTGEPVDGGPWTNSFDLLFRGVELVTGGQRLHRHADYVAALEARREPSAPYATYLEAFSHGMPPHGGFAIGLERWVSRLVGATNVREVTLVPRDLHRLQP
jgi:nondiscriminating aspartyl-tRNA synthetase